MEGSKPFPSSESNDELVDRDGYAGGQRWQEFGDMDAFIIAENAFVLVVKSRGPYVFLRLEARGIFVVRNRTRTGGDTLLAHAGCVPCGISCVSIIRTRPRTRRNYRFVPIFGTL